MNTPTLIGMPEPPSNPDTPTEAPGTPNSTTTSLSTLSTTAFKDGHRGNSFPHSGHGHRSTPSSNTLEAERADRISRLAGLERVSTARPPNPNLAPNLGAGGQIPGYFDQNGNPVYTPAKMSTVGSASATDGGRTTTWASGSASQRGADDESVMDGERDGELGIGMEADQMSTDANFRDMDERDRYSASAIDDDLEDRDGMSDDTSLVGFGEGAGSTVSGPTYSRKEALGRSALIRESSGTGSSIGGYGGDRGSGVVSEAAERILRDRLDDSDGRRPALGSPDEAGLGKFYFEEKK